MPLLTRSQTKAMDRKAGESLLAYEERLAAFIEEANDRAATTAKERKWIEQEEEAKRQQEEQDQLHQEEADLQAAAEHRSRQREQLFTRETVIGDETTHWVEMASPDEASETDKGLSAVVQIFHDLMATCALQHEEILHLQQTVDQMFVRLQALEKQPVAAAAAGPSNLATRVQVLEDDVNNIKRVHQDFRTSQQATNLQLETQVQAAATVTPTAASSRRPPKLDDLPVFCDQSKTDPIPWWRQFTLRLDMHHVLNNDRHACLYHRSGGACQAWLDNILTSHGVAVSELHTKLTWQELTDAWHKRFQVEPPDLQAMEKLNKLHQNSLLSQDWITEFQRLASTPDLPLAFRGIKHLFIMRSCPALQNALTQIAETLNTSDKLFSTASRIILRNVEARNAVRSSATSSNNQPKPKVACITETSPTSSTEAATPNEGDVLAASRDARYKANHDKCEFVRQELEYLGHLVPPEGIRPLGDKIQAIRDKCEFVQQELEYLGQLVRPKGIRPLADKIQANRDRCEFVRQELEYLGHLVPPSIRPLADKIQATQEWPEPKNVTDVRCLLGLAGYYQRFMKGYSKIAANLSKLQSEERPFDFDDDARHSFETLKAALLSAEVLHIYDPLLATRVTADASGYGIGAVLEQHDGTDWHSVEYFSKKVPPAHSIDDTRKKELLAFVHALKRWRHFLLGRKAFRWVTDNNPLVFYKSQDTINSTIARWMTFIDQFDFFPNHIPRKSNRFADTLSRQPDLCTAVYSTFEIDDDLRESFIRGYRADPDFRDKYANCSSQNPVPSHHRIQEGYFLVHSRAPELAEVLYTGWIRSKGYPKEIICDRETHFLSDFWVAVIKRWGSSLKPSSARHLQTDGQTERMHQTAQVLLRTLIHPDQVDWAERLPNVEFAYNSSIHPAIGMSPFEFEHGSPISSPLDAILPRTAESDDHLAFLRRMQELLVKARNHMSKTQIHMSCQANHNRLPCPFRASDLVWVSAAEFSLEQDISRKLLPKWMGPWRILSAVGDDPQGPSFRIAVPPHLPVHPVFHCSKFAPFASAESDEFPGRRTQDPPSMDGCHEAGYIITEWRHGNKETEFLLHVSYCSHKVDRWLTRSELQATAPTVLSRYLSKGKTTPSTPAPRHPRYIPPSDRQLRPRPGSSS
ncbi:hypothetical protein CBR_g37884 [Chara braunii]|uniref:Integrase catalytic domain-containing protein n=1 Tax=Chara braunii TaxID=69332 RepID=A0A388LNT4_CHABU|nr:hypothetical protein CBR_g37884 [Chara braunii]|eukprot:GBG84010.1 hypothetical protein CBR_g37884 [Chara braunii]